MKRGVPGNLRLKKHDMRNCYTCLLGIRCSTCLRDIRRWRQVLKLKEVK